MTVSSELKEEGENKVVSLLPFFETRVFSHLTKATQRVTGKTSLQREEFFIFFFAKRNYTR
jgi:hypothetical protein